MKTIGEAAFAGSRIASVTIAGGCTTISASAFAGCSELSSVTLPSSVTMIGASAFSDCVSLRSITLPSKLKSLQPSVFAGCTLLSAVVIPDKVTSVYNNAFFGCSHLTSLTIGAAVTSFRGDALNGCSRLASISVDAANTRYQAIDGVLFSLDGTALVRCPEGRADTVYTIPDGVTDVLSSAFCGTSLTRVTVSASVVSIESSAFLGAKLLQNIEFADGSVLQLIGRSAFQDCQSLRTVTLPDTVTTVGAEAFDCCYRLTGLTIPQGAAVRDGAIPTVEGLTVYGTAGSSAEAQALAAGVRFVDASAGAAALTAVNLNRTSVVLYPGETCTLTAALVPADTYETALTWTSSDPAVATVAVGVVEGRHAGSAVVRATGAGGISAACTVHVVKTKSTEYTILLDPSMVYFEAVGDSAMISAVVLPSMPADETITWTSADPATALVTGSRVIGLQAGTTTVTATLSNGASATAQVVVTNTGAATRQLKLPSRLTRVDEEAFSGLLVTRVICSGKLQCIERRAFANCPRLKRIDIPSSVTYIAPDAFEGSPNVKIYGAEGSYAQDYADEQGIPFVVK